MRNTLLYTIGFLLTAAVSVIAITEAPDVLGKTDTYVARQVAQNKAQAAEVDRYSAMLEEAR